MPDQTSETIARLIVEEFFCRFEICEQLHSDQGRQMEGNVFNQTCVLLGIRKTRTTPLHPASDRQTERQIKTVCDI